MKTIGAREASQGFAKLIDDAQHEAVTVERNGRPVAVVYSYVEAQQIEALKEASFQRFVDKGLKDVEEGRTQTYTRELLHELVQEGICRGSERK